MKHTCIKCNVNLIADDNWRPSSQKYKVYKCNPCRTNTTKKWQKENWERWQQKFNEYINAKQGVYGIFSGDKCLYVGQSKVLNSRTNRHRNYFNTENKRGHHQPKLYEKLDKYENKEIRILEECTNHKEREKYWINKLRPLFNSYSYSQ